jgi:putative peptidoglycan lipid II flippase
MAPRTLTNSQIIRAAFVVLLGFLASGVLGLVRLAVLSTTFGTSEALEAFTAAQRIPETIFTLVAGGALGSSFIPIYARVRQNDEQEGWRLASAVMTLSAGAALLMGLVVFVVAEPLAATVLLPGRGAAAQALTANLMRIMMLTPAIFSISGLVMGILQSNGYFLLPSLAISMNHIGIIAGALLIAPALNAEPGVAQVGRSNVYGLAYGAVVSALLHLLVQVPGLVRLRARLRVLPDPRLPGVLDVLRLMVPRSLGLGVVQFNYIVNIFLGSMMISGSLVALNVAFSLVFFALGIIGQSVGSAVFPTLAALKASGDIAGFRNRLHSALRSVLFLALPAVMVFIVLGEPLVTAFENGEWTRDSTQATAWALAFYAIGIPGFALLEILSRAFYALEDTWTPVLVGIAAMISNVLLSLILVGLVGSPDSLVRGAFAGLALANAATTNVEALALWWLLRRRIGSLSERVVLYASLKVAVATLLMSFVFAAVLAVFPQKELAAGLAALLAGAAAFAVAALVLRVEEAGAVFGLLVRRVRR